MTWNRITMPTVVSTATAEQAMSTSMTKNSKRLRARKSLVMIRYDAAMAPVPKSAAAAGITSELGPAMAATASVVMPAAARAMEAIRRP